MTWRIDIENVAGILGGTGTIEPGLNAVRASNWQGKSSFVEAVKVGLGVSEALTEGTERGGVRMETPDRTVDVALRRENGGVVRRGTPYLTDEYDRVRTELFACLDETNELRHRVRRGEDLEDVLLRPLDFQNIDQRIADLQRERERVASELAGAREAKKRLPSLEETVTRLESELADLRERRERLVDDDGGDLQSARSDLAAARSERDRAASRVERLERRLERTETRFAEKRAELEDIEVADAGDIESDLAAARDELDGLKRDVEVLQSVHSATEMALAENRLDLLSDVERDLSGDRLPCWTCGTEVDREAVETRLAALGERVASARAAVESCRDRVETLEARREEIEQSRRRKQSLEETVADLEAKLTDQRDALADARQRRDRLAERIEELSASVDESVGELTDVESDIKYREAELKDARDELASLEDRADRVEHLTETRDRLRADIEDLRNRKDELQRRTRAAFDDAMADILARFDTGFETARLTSEFDLVVARDGREASLDALSEGELELLGFVAALAGHESFDVAGTVPVMLVDGVAGLDDGNLHTLVEYLKGRAEYLVFTVHPEYGGFDGHQVDPADWTIASERETPAD